jgi:hypothetical protein
MSAPQKITLARAAAALPFSLKTIYNGHSAGRFPWVSRYSPEGRKTRELWVDIEALKAWAEARGYSLDVLGGGKN